MSEKMPELQPDAPGLVLAEEVCDDSGSAEDNQSDREENLSVEGNGDTSRDGSLHREDSLVGLAEWSAVEHKLNQGQITAWDVFISHAGAGGHKQLLAFPLHYALEEIAPDLNVFVDELSMRYGVDNRREISQAMESSRVIVIVPDSHHFFNTKNTLMEVEQALKLRKERGTLILPVFLSDFDETKKKAREQPAPKGWTKERYENLLEDFFHLTGFRIHGESDFRIEYLAELVKKMAVERLTFERDMLLEIKANYHRKAKRFMKKPGDLEKFLARFAVPEREDGPALSFANIHLEMRKTFTRNFLQHSRTRQGVFGAIVGKSGFGKTTTAKSIAHKDEIRDFFTGGIFWRELGQNPDIRQIVEDLWNCISYEQDLPAEEEALYASLKSLLKDEKRYLFIFDNVLDHNDADSIMKIIPEGGRNSVIFTMRTQDALPESFWTRGMKPCKLGRLSLKESHHLIETRLDFFEMLDETNCKSRVLKRITELARGVPLVLDFVARYLKKQCSTWTAAGSSIGEVLFRGLDDEDRTANILAYVLEDLEEEYPGAEEHLKTLASFETTESVSKTDIKIILDPCGEVDALCEAFKVAGFLTPEENNENFKIHDLVREFFKERKGFEETKSKAETEFADRLLCTWILKWTPFACVSLASIVRDDPKRQRKVIERCLEAILQPNAEFEVGREERKKSLEVLLNVLSHVKGVDWHLFMPLLDIITEPNCSARREIARLITILRASESATSEFVDTATDTFRKAMSSYPWLFPYIPSDLKHDALLVEEVVSTCGSMLQFVPEEFQSEKSIVLSAVGSDPRALCFNKLEDEDDEARIFLDHIVSSARWQMLEKMRDATRKRRDVVLKLLKISHDVLKFAHEELRKEEGFLVSAVQTNGLALKHAILDEYSREEVEEAAVKENGMALEFCSKESRGNKSLVREAVERDPRSLQFAQNGLKHDKEFVLQLMEVNGKAIEFVAESLRNDFEVALAAMTHDSDVCRYLNDDLLKHPKIVVHLKNTENILRLSPDSMENYNSIVKEHIRKHGIQFEHEHVHQSLLNNEEIMKLAVQQNGCALNFASNRLKANSGIVMEAVKQTWKALVFADNSLKNDRRIALKAIAGNGMALEFLSPDLKKDKDIVKTAVKANWRALKFADWSLRGNFEVAILSVSKKWEAFEFVDYHISLKPRVDELVKASIECSKQSSDGNNEGWKALEFASDRLKDDKEYILSVITSLKNAPSRWSALEFVSARLKDDQDVVRAAIAQTYGGWRALKFAGRKILQDMEMFKFAISKHKNWGALTSASVSLRRNREMVLHAIQNGGFLSWKAFGLADQVLKTDADFVVECLMQPVRNIQRILDFVDDEMSTRFMRLKPYNSGVGCWFMHALENLDPSTILKLSIRSRKDGSSPFGEPCLRRSPSSSTSTNFVNSGGHQTNLNATLD